MTIHLPLPLARLLVGAGRRASDRAEPVAGGFQELAAVLVAEGPRQTALLPRDPRGTCAVNVEPTLHPTPRGSALNWFLGRVAVVL